MNSTLLIQKPLEMQLLLSLPAQHVPGQASSAEMLSRNDPCRFRGSETWGWLAGSGTGTPQRLQQRHEMSLGSRGHRCGCSKLMQIHFHFSPAGAWMERDQDCSEFKSSAFIWSVDGPRDAKARASARGLPCGEAMLLHGGRSTNHKHPACTCP